MFKTFCAFFVLAAAAHSQPISVGLKFGVPLSDAFSVQSPNPFQYVAETRRYTVGPYLDLRLPARVALEIDALYKSYEYRVAGSSISASSWEFPVLAKYKFLPGPLQPYIEGGIAFSRLTDVPQVIELNNKNNFGVVAGAGVEFRLRFVRISPEIRYNGWSRRFFDGPGNYLQSNRNQAAVSVGVSF